MDGAPPKYEETQLNPWLKIAATYGGSLLCCVSIVIGFVLLVGYIPVGDGSNDGPGWSKTWVYLSIAHHLDVYGEAAFPPPPPPGFENGKSF